MHRSALALVIAVGVLAQAPQTPPATGSVSGIVRDAGTGSPIQDVKISARKAAGKSVDATTDSNGSYVLRDLPAGQTRIEAIAPSEMGVFGARATRSITLPAGQELTGIDIAIRSHAEISGKIIDQNKEPVPGLSVRLVAREYSLGSLRYVFANAARTDDRGEYSMKRVEPGRGYLLVVQKEYQKLDPISESPVNPKLRRPAMVPTYYPGTLSYEGAQALVLRPGEKREGIDIQILRTPSYCMDAQVQSGGGEVYFQIAEPNPHSGASGNGSSFFTLPGGTVGPDGKLRLCDLHPGEFILTASTRDSTFYGTAAVNIIDEDVNKVLVFARPHIAVPGEVAWDGTPPDPPDSSQIGISLNPLTRTGNGVERAAVRTTIPGSFSLNGFLDEYALQIFNVPTGSYIKEVNYGGQNVLNEPFRPGTAVGESGLRITLARDGGTISAKVADKDNNPIGDATVVVMPASVTSEGMLAATMLSGQTDQTGAWTSALVRPGKYYVITSQLPVDKSPECVGKLLRARTKAHEVEIGPGATVQVVLAPAEIE